MGRLQQEKAWGLGFVPLTLFWIHAWKIRNIHPSYFMYLLLVLFLAKHVPVNVSSLKAYPHQRRIGIRPELTKRITIDMFGNSSVQFVFRFLFRFFLLSGFKGFVS